MIASESIERVKEADLIEVLQKVLPADLKFKKAGANYMSLSPFVSEKSGSFSANQRKDVWKCFSSGKGGKGAISFIMEYKKLSFIQAVEFVADVCKIIIQRVELDDDEKLRVEEIQKQRDVLEWTGKRFRNSYKELPVDHWAKQNFLSRGYDEKGFTEEAFLIGYATPSGSDITNILKEKGAIYIGQECGIIGTKENRNFDFFNDRLIFPIQDEKGRVVAFGGRASDAAIKKKSPKYLNSPETKHYKKEYVLYGLYQARQHIIKNNAVYLTEGYTDVIAFHDKYVQNTVATCGTSLSEEHIKKLKKICSEIILVRDGDGAGIKAAYRDIDLCLASGIKVSVVPMPQEQDPDSISRQEKENLQNWLNVNKQNALLWKATRLKNSCDNPDDISFAVSDLCTSLMKIKDVIRRKEYAKECAKKLKIPFKDFNEKLESIENAEKQALRRERVSNDDEKYSLIKKGFPEDGDIDQYKEDGYAISNAEKSLYFQAFDNKGNEYFFRGANFVINPLFTIKSAKDEGKRLIEFENRIGEKTVFALNNKQITNFQMFKEAIVDGYNFTFDAQTNNFQFTQFKNKMLYNFKSAVEIKTLGTQKNNFFALANGVILNNDFFEVDEYGIVPVEVEEDTEENIKAFKGMFYLPAFSKVNTTTNEDDDEYESVRKFIYIESKINLNQWMGLMDTVYGKEKAMIGIAFAIASIYRSIIVHQFGQFPYLFLTGQRQSGKTKFSESLTNLFTPGQKSYDLNTGTMVAFYNRVSKIRDIVVGLEEFTDQIHEIKFQALKAGFDNRSREKGQKTGESNSSVRINSACVIMSQYLSVRDDNSLTSRSITETFVENNYTEEQKSNFGRLKEFERQGMTSLLKELLKHRSTVEKELKYAIEEINRQLLKDLKNANYMERMLENYVSIMSPIKILFNKFVFPFTWDEFYKYCLERIVTASEMISDTEGTATFWRILEYLTDKKIIQVNVDFKIEEKRNFKIMKNKKEDEIYKNDAGDKILFLRMNKVHQDYTVESSRRKTDDFIGEATLKGYFKSKVYFIGSVRAMSFQNTSTSCLAFNYTQMEKLGVLNIERDFGSQKPDYDPNHYTESKKDSIPVIGDDEDSFL